MDSSNNVIGKWTTHSITYKPSKVEMADVAEIYVTVSQGGKDILELGVFNSNGNITRSNALEVTKDGGLILKSPSGTKYKISVDDSGNISTTAV